MPTDPRKCDERGTTTVVKPGAVQERNAHARAVGDGDLDDDQRGPSDAVPGSNKVIVDSAFVEQVLGGGSVLGRRVRHWELTDAASGERSPGPWHEIVGVVPAFTPPPPFEPDAPKLYQPLALAGVTESVQLAVRMRSGAAPATFLGRAREITDSVDPTLRLALQTASEAERLLRKGLLSLALAIVAITGSVLLLSAAGLYAMMSFTVASRRREIGIRVALGAAPGRVLGDIFRAGGPADGGITR